MSWGGGKGGGKGGSKGYQPNPGQRSSAGGYGGDAAGLFQNQNATGINFDEAHKQPVEVSPVDPKTPPIATWAAGNLHPDILANITRCNYRAPTPIQKYGIPIAAAGKDLVGCAQTGSGKTAAFLLPSIHTLLVSHFNAQSDGRTSNIGALILAPTRELAMQIFEEAQKFCFRTPIRPAVVYGGADFKPQIQALSQGVEMLVATPGRFIDHFEKERVSLRYLKVFVMDEADRMLDMGFEPTIRQIATRSGMPRRRQTLMFSATFPPVVQRLAQDFVGETYTFMTVGRVGSTHEHIKQAVVWVEEEQKRLMLLGILLAKPGLTLVFANTKQEISDLGRFLREQGVRLDSIHGDRSQYERETALQKFKDGVVSVLCATDVAARGLDIQGVSLVVQYDLPNEIDDCMRFCFLLHFLLLVLFLASYNHHHTVVHRTGRTGRAGNKGTSISFMNQKNKGLAPELCTLMSEAKQSVPSWLRGMASAAGGPAGMITVCRTQHSRVL